MIPLCIPEIDEREFDAVRRVLQSGWLTHGPENNQFEELFANYVGTEHAISLNSCASALFLSLVAQDIKGEVIIPSFTFSATANAVVAAGATPVFADVELHTGNLDADDVASRITPRCEAIIPVHFAGQPCDMDAILGLAEQHGLAVIEDAAETLGGEFQGRKAGSFATGCFSFFPTKNITTGEGGMLTTDDQILADRVRTLAAHGILSSTALRQDCHTPWAREAVLPGFNLRMSALQAAMGVEQMKKLDSMNSRRRARSALLDELLASEERIRTPRQEPGRKHVYQMYTVQVVEADRNDFVRGLRERGIGASVHFDPPVHLQAYYKENHACESLPSTEKLSQTIVTLPMYPSISAEQIHQIATTVRETLDSQLQSNSA